MWGKKSQLSLFYWLEVRLAGVNLTNPCLTHLLCLTMRQKDSNDAKDDHEIETRSQFHQHVYAHFLRMQIPKAQND